ncbi:sugar-binding protein [Niastella vici]|nr:sugar-binding protein [Niastella vici]
MASTITGNTHNAIPLINKKYNNKPRLAALVNIPDYCDTMQSFTIKQDAAVQVYGVGELVRPLAQVRAPYFLKNDDLEFFFHPSQNDHRNYLFTAVEGFMGTSGAKKSAITFSKKIDSTNHTAEFLISIPWNELGTQPKEGVEMDFDFAVGDNDDGIRQEGKIGWHTGTDPLVDHIYNYGKLRLTAKKDLSSQQDCIYSKYKTTDTLCWDNIPATAIEKVIAGEVKDKYDCGALLRSCWDKKNLYFLVRVYDFFIQYERRYISKEKVSTLKTLCDYGYIEDDKGRIVWAMSAMNTIHAGGCVKNRLADTVISLKAGTYTLKYSSDESHAYGHWDADPPLTPFYGIVLYQAN